MPTYIALIDWTEQGVRNFKDTVDRYEAASGQLEALESPSRRSTGLLVPTTSSRSSRPRTTRRSPRGCSLSPVRATSERPPCAPSTQTR